MLNHGPGVEKQGIMQTCVTIHSQSPSFLFKSVLAVYLYEK